MKVMLKREKTNPESCEKIETLRQKMVYVGQTKGIDHPETIRLSQKLDNLLNQYQQKIIK
ncbi:hypothetical protein BKP35_06490 [Anaerobacillus arseniciselenatis]|uniref:Spo0E family sporulation regulatory protein-aspartic acid phosphatase n=1 Tax=Anaerobacillus arseniciselenatis TaxID=85682 RepID=A0A1S2LQX9_9BACI|nr:aspartyl-phosphate phosphatase Spo0E family protein [Anaerobacillus arseniciselenatis]OIJ14523.1 hypothetical protein BKP35_06490 [Anaerobacillus arseniciselenatis]